MNSVIYNIPIHMFEAYRGRKVIVRSNDVQKLADCLSQEDMENVLYLQLLSLNCDVEPLTNWGESVPIDILVRNPAVEFPLLYLFSKLLDKHPIRASISVRPGFSKAVKLALALNFTVKLVVGQPIPPLVEEMEEVLDLYLHRSTVAQPVEYFHSLFLSFYHQEPFPNLWLIQEEDPEQFRFIADNGAELVAPRLDGIELKGDGGVPDGAQREALLGEQSECDGCEYLERCGGYFKWPDKEFSCEGVKSIFGTLRTGAEELRNNLAAFQASQGGLQS
jgi:hypothetical protein